jgi:hypothetical protein
MLKCCTLVGTEYIHESARLSLQSSELAPPAPSPAGEGSQPPPPRFQGGGHTLLRGRGKGEPIWTKGQTLWYSRYCIITLRWWGWEGVVLSSC